MLKFESQKKSSFKKYLFINLCLPLILIIFIIILSICTFLGISESKKLNIFLINEANLLANTTQNSKLHEIIASNRFINKNSSIIFRDPIAKYEIIFTRSSPFPLEQFDQLFLEKKCGFFTHKAYKVFFAESFLSRICIIIIPKIYFNLYIIKIFIIGFIIFLFLILFIWFLLLKVEKRTVNDLLKQYVMIKYMIEGKYDENQSSSVISEIDNIKYGLNNLIKVLRERREFYNSLVLFQKKVLDLIPAGILIFNNKDLFEDANNFGYAQIEREINKNNLEVEDFPSILNEKLNIKSIITEESLNKINTKSIVELDLKPNITFSKKVFGKIISDKKIIILVPLNIIMEDEENPEDLFYKKSLVSFISDFAHELRSPLNSILGFSQIIEDGVEGNNIEEIINDSRIINESAQIMMAFIDDIIFLSRIGKVLYEPIQVSFSIKKLLTLINHYFKGIFKNKEIELDLPDIDKAEDLEVIADFQSIRRVIILILFYIRSLVPLPSKISLTLIKEEKSILITLSYFLNSKITKRFDYSDKIFEYCQTLTNKASLNLICSNDLKNVEENKESFEIRFNYKINE